MPLSLQLACLGTASSKSRRLVERVYHVLHLKFAKYAAERKAFKLSAIHASVTHCQTREGEAFPLSAVRRCLAIVVGSRQMAMYSTYSTAHGMIIALFLKHKVPWNSQSVLISLLYNPREVRESISSAVVSLGGDSFVVSTLHVSLTGLVITD